MGSGPAGGRGVALARSLSCARRAAARLKQLPPQLDDVVFVKDPVPGVKGPLVSRQGLHLVYLHSCGEPMGRTEALFSPPPGLQRKLDEALGRGPGGA